MYSDRKQIKLTLNFINCFLPLGLKIGKHFVHNIITKHKMQYIWFILILKDANNPNDTKEEHTKTITIRICQAIIHLLAASGYSLCIIQFFIIHLHRYWNGYMSSFRTALVYTYWRSTNDFKFLFNILLQTQQNIHTKENHSTNQTIYIELNQINQQ